MKTNVTPPKNITTNDPVSALISLMQQDKNISNELKSVFVKINATKKTSK